MPTGVATPSALSNWLGNLVRVDSAVLLYCPDSSAGRGWWRHASSAREGDNAGGQRGRPSGAQGLRIAAPQPQNGEKPKGPGSSSEWLESDRLEARRL